YGCKQEAAPEPVVQEEVVVQPTAEEIAAAQHATEQASYKLERSDLLEQYTHTVANGEGIWGLVGDYAGVPGTKNVVDEVCNENGMKYLGLPPEVLRFEPFTPVFEDGAQVNCNLIYEGQVLDVSYLSSRLGELETLID
ncbi:hypothetical protein GOV10_03575, partial [Candidatus Woesearchaeota archaeon]|nr:hypothetical protein [Candidatus Woesearchaeota archaeon]